MCSSDAQCVAQVLYTDVDTIFMEDINSCSLPSPRILSAAGEVTTPIMQRSACRMHALVKCRDTVQHVASLCRLVLACSMHDAVEPSRVSE